MSKKILTTPIRSEDLEDIRIGDIIYLNGYLITARDCAHTRLVKHGRKIPVDLAGKAIFHAGPIMVPDQSSGSGFKVVSIGPTTSMRMEKFEKEFIEETGALRPCTASSRAAARYLPHSASKRSKMCSGRNWACPSRSGSCA